MILELLPRARRDVLQQILYLEREGDEDLAIRYFHAVMATSQILEAQPFIGDRDTRNTEFRRFPVQARFDKFLIYYRFVPGRIEVVRVLHGNRDIKAGLLDLNGL